jgi:hypothetical protein
MTNDKKCTCEKPLLHERSDRKGASQSWCGRCKRPLAPAPGRLPQRVCLSRQAIGFPRGAC